MAEHPAGVLLRLLGGVALMRGRLGHQVLGQMLVMGTSDVAIAGATVVVAATTRQRNAVAQVALRTAAPAIAASVIIQRQEARVERREALVAERERAVQQTSVATATAMEALEFENRTLKMEHDRLCAQVRALTAAPSAAAKPKTRRRRDKR